MMLRFVAVLTAIALIAVPATGQRRPARTARPAAQINWLERATQTPLGSFVLGNPAAKVKLVEYASFTCSHCAAFQAESKAALEPLIRSGQVSWEVRNAVRDRFDLAAALVARCRGPVGYFRAADAIFAAQAQWLGRAATMAEPAATSSMADALMASVRATGLDKIAAPGIAPAKLAACVASGTEQGKLARMRDEAWNERRISGTPSFLVNGTAVPDAYDWAALEPALRAAL